MDRGIEKAIIRTKIAGEVFEETDDIQDDLEVVINNLVFGKNKKRLILKRWE